MKQLISYALAALILTLSVSHHAPASAEMRKIDRGAKTWGKSEGYWIMFVARDNVPGHAFVVWGIRDRKNRSWKSLRGYGLYPRDAAKVAFGSVPGRIARESTRSLKGADNGLAVAVSKQMFEYSLTNTRAIGSYPTQYNLLTENCVHFTDLVARAISLNTPTMSNFRRHPQGYIAALKNRN